MTTQTAPRHPPTPTLERVLAGMTPAEREALKDELGEAIEASLRRVLAGYRLVEREPVSA